MSAQVRLNIADIILALEFDDPAVAQLVGEVYGGFVTKAEPDGGVKLDWRFVDCDLPQQNRPTVAVEDGVYRVRSQLVNGDLDLRTATGHLAVDDLHGLREALWAIAVAILPEREGLAVHAASVASDGQAYVFPAPSGTGKSTLVRNSPGKTVLADEGTLLRMVQGRLYAYGSPLRSGEDRDFCYSRYPVRGLFFLQQAPHDRVRPIPPAEVFARLLGETFMYGACPHGRRAAARVAESIVRTTNGQVLELRNSPDFWEVLSP